MSVILSQEYKNHVSIVQGVGVTFYHFEQEVKDSKTAAGSKSNTKSLARAPDGI